MAKLKNFTLEGEYFVLVAHLELGEPVVDLVPKHDLALMAMNAGGFDRISQAISDDLYDLCRSYESESLVKRFAKEWAKSNPEEARDA